MEVNAGDSFGYSPLRREIGVGEATMIDEVAIFWPVTGTTQVIKNLKPNQFIEVKEGAEGFTPLPLQALVFKRKDGTTPMCAPVR